MSKTILVAGGYGLVGSHIARHLRRIMPDARLIIAGRNPDKAADIVSELGNADALGLETTDPVAALESVGKIDALIAALQDPHDKMLTHAINNGIAHLSITRSVLDMSGFVGHLAHANLTAPVVPTAHWQAGILSLTALDLASQFKTVDSIALSALFDMTDPIGPMTVEDAGHFFGKALLVRDNLWTWVDPDAEVTSITIDGETFDARPMSNLDTMSLRSATNAADITFHLGIANSRGTRAGGAASHDMQIIMKGTDANGSAITRTRLVSDPRGQAQLTATGAALAVQRAIGGDGKPAPTATLHMPETLLDAAGYTARLQSEFGILVQDAGA
jgi:NAD(P)-dependent dehydrogenase (short-subunit alcohol dehydrogenase family)